MVFRCSAAFVLIAATIISGCAGKGKQSTGTSIDRSFTVAGYQWKTGGTVYVFLTARESQGRAEVCAARMATKAAVSTYRYNDDALAAASVFVDGDRVLTGLAFSNVLDETNDVLGEPANCRLSSAAWKPSYDGAEVTARIPRQRFMN